MADIQARRGCDVVQNGRVVGQQYNTPLVDQGDGTHAEKVELAGSGGQWFDVTLTCDTAAQESGGIIADTQVISDAFRLTDGAGALFSLKIIDEDDQGAALTVLFFDADVPLGTENSPPLISDAAARNYLCHVDVSTGDYKDLGGVKVASIGMVNQGVKAIAGTRNLAVAVLNGSGTPTYTASGLKLRGHIL